MPSVKLSLEELVDLYTAAKYPIVMENGLTDNAKDALKVLQEEILSVRTGIQLGDSDLSREFRIDLLTKAAKDMGLEDLPT